MPRATSWLHGPPSCELWNCVQGSPSFSIYKERSKAPRLPDGAWGLFVNSRSERDDGSSEADKAAESVGKFIGASSDAAEVLDPLEEILDQMALAITRLAIASFLLAVGARRKAGFGKR